MNTSLVLGLTIVTLLSFTVFGIWNARGRVRSVEDLISARGSVQQGSLTATLVASVMGVWILFSAPEAGAGFGIGAVVGYGIGEALPMLAYSRLGPRIRTLIPDGHTLTEYARARYGNAMYGFILLVSALYMFVFLSAELTGIAGALALVADVPQYQTALLVGGFVVLYTGYGGLRASIATDTLQAVVVLPVLILAFGATIFALGGAGSIHTRIVETSPTLLDPGFLTGLQFGLALVFAILGAELINQTWWQRIYAADSDRTVRSGFRTATVANGTIVFAAALFGVVAAGSSAVVTDISSEAYNADVAFFVLLESIAPEWVVLAVVLLALLLVMSSVDTLFNALASLVTVDLARLTWVDSDRHLRTGARLFTVLVALGAIYVSLRARSVLRLFFFADLLGAAVAFPLLYGLYSRSLSGTGALLSSLAGLAVGLAYFPDLRGVISAIPLLGEVLPAADPLYLTSFAGAFIVAAGSTVIAARVGSTAFELDGLATEIRQLDTPATTGGSEVERGPD